MMYKLGFSAILVTVLAVVGSFSLMQIHSLKDEKPAQAVPVSKKTQNTDTEEIAKDNVSGTAPEQALKLSGADLIQTDIESILFCLPMAGGTSDTPRRECMTRDVLLSRESEEEKLKTDEPTSSRLSVEMVPPRGVSDVPERIYSCTDFNARKSDGWGGITSLDMAKEATFEARCGIMKLARIAQVAGSSHFLNNRLNNKDIKTVPINNWPHFGPAATRSNKILVTREAEGVWKLQYAGVVGRLTEIAHADFNEDGVGDILSYLAISPKGGTARISGFGVFEKSPAQIRFSILSVY